MVENRSKYEEWFFQSDYDLDTAIDMQKSGRSVPTRYPDDLRRLFTEYTKERTESILKQTKEIQSWIKQQ